MPKSTQLKAGTDIRHPLRQSLVWLSLAIFLTACGDTHTPSSNAVPVAVIDASAVSGPPPLSVTFNANQSFDPDGQVTAFEWDFGNGSTGSGATVTHQFDGLGTFNVSLRVIDDAGASQSTAINIRTHIRSAGYYTGSASSDYTGTSIPIEVIIGTNNRIYAFDHQGLRTSFWGNLNDANNLASGTLSAAIQGDEFVFPHGGNAGSVRVDGTVLPREAISATYFGAADTGIVDIQYVERVSERETTLDDVAGRWHWSDSAGFTANVIVVGEGQVSYDDSNGCNGNGSLTLLHPMLNAFEFQMEWYCPNATDPAWNGTSEGLAFIDDYYVPGLERLVFAESHWHGTSDVWAVERSGGLTSIQTGTDTFLPPDEERGANPATPNQQTISGFVLAEDSSIPQRKSRTHTF